MYSKVIVPLDGSELAEQALPYARLVAAATSVPVELVSAYDVLPPALHDHGAMLATREMLVAAQRESESYLAGVCERLRAAGCDAAPIAMPGAGAPERAIVERATQDPQALLVMSTHGRSGVTRWALGSVADKVLHAVPNPALIMHAVAAGGSRLERGAEAERGAEPDIGFAAALVPLDGSSLAELSLPHAITLAEALGVGVELVRVTPTADYYRSHLAGPFRRMVLSRADAAAMVEELIDTDEHAVSAYFADVQERMAAQGQPAGGVAAQHLLRDDVAQAIIDRATERQALTVMTTHGRSGWSRMLMGSVTDRVIHHSRLPLLVVRGPANPPAASADG